VLRPALATPVFVVGLVGLCVAPHAEAQAAYPPLTDRHFTLDGYLGATVASYRIVGMGGTSLATAEGAASLTSNPASVASRLATWNDWFEWDWSVDTYTPELATDFDNNGVDQGDSAGSTIAGNAALTLYFGHWGFGLSVVSEQRDFSLMTGEPASLSAEVLRFTVGRGFMNRELTVGLSAATGIFSLGATQAGGDQIVPLVEAVATTLEAGALWRPPGRDLRVGGRMSLAVSPELAASGCDPDDCLGYVLPEKLEFPWSAGAGVAWRVGPTRWNTVVHDDWRDERALVLAADLLVTGTVRRGAGIEEFLDHQLQPSGRHVVASVRAGAEYEWVPGWWRVRGGSYWEPGRFEGVGGRLHITLGFDVRVWSFCFWDDRYRLRLSFGADGASRYTNALLSLGFWH
jgi:hypothetical protein